MLRLFKKKKFDIEAYIAGSFEGLQLVTQSHRNTWKLGQEQSWNVDEDQGRITFTFADGNVVSAPAQIIGTYDTNNDTFTWGWEHPSVALTLQVHAARVKTFGEQYGSRELTTQKVPCTEKRAWEYTALAMLLAEAYGAYCAQAAPGILVFMTFGEIEIGKQAEK